MYMCDYCKNIPVSRTIEWIVEEWWFVWPMHRTRMYVWPVRGDTGCYL